MIEYKFKVTALCPNGGRRDYYKAVMLREHMIEVERILEITEQFVLKKIFQEDLAKVLSDELGATVLLEGRHEGIVVKGVI